MTHLMVLVLAVILAGIVVIGALLAPEQNLTNFWGSIAWIIVLVFINWLTSAYVVNDRSAHRDGAPGDPLGSLPGIGIVTFVYAVASVGILMLFQGGAISGLMHLATQIALFVIAAVLVLLALITAKGAAYGAEASVSQVQLVEGLRRLQRMTEDYSMRDRIQSQINYISYRLPHPSKLNRDALARALKAIEVADPSSLENALEEFKQHLGQA
jgi:hypothetical protein